MVATVRRSGWLRGGRRGAAAAVLAWVCAQAAHALPSFDEVKGSFRPSDTVLRSREGEELQRLRTDASVRRGQWVALADVSPALREALVRSEDQRFYAHSGVDWHAVSAAAWANLWHQRTRGASTITMQLAGLLDDDWRAGPGGRTLAQKVGQGVAAQRLEQSWRKDQILEAYLNLVPFRGEIVGLDALSRSLFGKAAQGLDAREAAIAAALVRAPNARAEQVARRACTVLQALQPQGAGQSGSARQGMPPSAARSEVQANPQSVCAGLDAYTAAMLQRRAWDASAGVAPHFMRYLLRTLRAQPAGRAAAQEQGTAVPVPVPTPAPLPTELRSSLRAGLQRFAVQTLTQQLRELQGRGVEDGAVLVLDNASGEVLAWVGSSGTLSQAAEVDGVQALRQPGSTLKPFLYAQALAENRLTAASLLDDAPTAIATPGGLYVPQNYDRRFRGWVSVRTALAASLNVPAVRTLVLVSPDAFHQQLRTLGLPLRESGGYYGYSLALGSPEVSLLQLTQAYRTLALGGRTGPLRLQPAAKAPQAASLQRVLDGRAAFIVGDILSDGNARAPTFGTDSVLATRFWTAVKTGTSKDMRDNWALGWSQRYTVGVWVGNASGAAMHEVSGSSGAAPIWAALMGYLHAHEPSRAPAPPPGLRRVAVRFAGPGEPAPEPARAEWFIAGTEQAVFAIDKGACSEDGERTRGQKGLKHSTPMPCGPAAQATARITAPAPGSIIALDPDIPPARQRLQLHAAGPGSARLQWRLDGKPLGRGARLSWLPWPGRHVLQLADAQGRVLDELRFEVRGAGVRAGP
ncbi:penicillin-binding protein 1C [Extensimonas sp. H3M7-6]|uniref:penicillin-binding protein 1C n=1 Tax=Extensimonas soli TaxID=3031322 RepID=UPI0023DB2A5F|nr:penicillin-binding protein 1C [Extensimonas sp. H3M7-6]MDF1482665.1 penicillin-binding protein 1C [Extensimonas sp. H3M7-6]